MRSDWDIVRADKFIDFNPKETIRKGEPSKKVAMEQLQPHTRDISGYELTPFNGGSKFRNGDTLMARITPCLENGKTAQVNILENDEVGFGSTEFIVMREIPGVSNSDFIYYLALSPFWRNKAIKSMVGSSGRQRVQQSVLDSVELCVPSLPEQREIARTLRALDDKIANNANINHHLEQMAQAIFSEKFGKYISGLETLPKLWNKTCIADLDLIVTDYVANGSFKSLSDNVTYTSEETANVLIRLTDYNNNYASNMVYIDDTAYEFLSKSKLFGDEIIISNVGANVGTVFRCPRLSKKMSLAPNSIMLKSKLFEHYLYMYFISPFGQQQLNSIVTGSAQPKFNKTNFRSLEIVIPDDESLNELNSLYNPINEQMCIYANENARLSEFRDMLLPKLMSGELSIAYL